MDWTRIINNGLEASVGLQAVVFALAAIGLNVQFGYTGLLNFGQSGFLAVAAYGLAVTVSTYDLYLGRYPCRRYGRASKLEASIGREFPGHRCAISVDIGQNSQRWK